MLAESESNTVKYRSTCPVARSLDLLGDKWTLLVMRDALFFSKKLRLVIDVIKQFGEENLKGGR